MAKLYLGGIAVLVAILCCQTAVAYGEIGNSTFPFNVATPACTGLCASNPYEYGFQMGKSDILSNISSLDDSCTMYGPHPNQQEPPKEIQCLQGYEDGLKSTNSSTTNTNTGRLLYELV